MGRLFETLSKSLKFLSLDQFDRRGERFGFQRGVSWNHNHMGKSIEKSNDFKHKRLSANKSSTATTYRGRGLDPRPLAGGGARLPPPLPAKSQGALRHRECRKAQRHRAQAVNQIG